MGADLPMKPQKTLRTTGTACLAVALATWVLGFRGAWGEQGGDPVPREHMQHMPGHEKAEGGGKHEDGEHGPPEGWKFTLPRGGDPARGRAVFVKYECFACHEVKGQRFPRPATGGAQGPELSAMAPHHPPEFFAESIINPGAVIDQGRGYEGPDGSSKMPSFNGLMTVQELVDLVAYLVNLKPPAAAASAPGAPRPGGPHNGH